MGYSIATSGESLPMLDQTNKRHISSLQELCVKPCRRVFLLDHLGSRYCPCNDQAVSDLNNIGSSMTARTSHSSSARGVIVALYITCVMLFDRIGTSLHLHCEPDQTTFKTIEVRQAHIPSHFLTTDLS